MAYIYESTNNIRIICIDTFDDIEYQVLDFSGLADYKPKDENTEIENINDEIMSNNIGMRMIINVAIMNNTDINSQEDIINLFTLINLVKVGGYVFKVYPSWDTSMQSQTLDVFTCITEGYYTIEKLHRCLKSGQDIKVIFKEVIPHKEFIPQVPTTEVLRKEPIPYNNAFIIT